MLHMYKPFARCDCDVQKKPMLLGKMKSDTYEEEVLNVKVASQDYSFSSIS